MLLISN
jgi:hypothetical protein